METLNFSETDIPYGKRIGEIYTFTHANQSNHTGSTKEEVDNAYLNTNLEERVTVNDGVQEWIVPSTRRYLITTLGAKGRDIKGSNGGKISGIVELKENDVLQVEVYKQGFGGGLGEDGGHGEDYVHNAGDSGECGGGGKNFIISTATNKINETGVNADHGSVTVECLGE